MARTGQLRADETLREFAARLGISYDDLMTLNPDVSAESLMEGLVLNIPDAVASSTSQAPAPESAAPTGEMAGGAEGLFQEMLKDFASAFRTWLSAPAFLQEVGGMTRHEQMRMPGLVGEAAKRPTAGWTRQEAEFLRSMESELQQRYEEAAQRQLAEHPDEIPTLTPAEFLRGIKPREEMEMQRPYRRGGGTTGVPSISPRRLRF